MVRKLRQTASEIMQDDRCHSPSTWYNNLSNNLLIMRPSKDNRELLHNIIAMAAPPASEGPLNSPDALLVSVEEVTPACLLTKALGRPVRAATLIEPIHGTAS